MIGGTVLSCCSNVTINHSQWPAGYDRIKANETLWCFTGQQSVVFLRLPFSPTSFYFSLGIFGTTNSCTYFVAEKRYFASGQMEYFVFNWNILSFRLSLHLKSFHTNLWNLVESRIFFKIYLNHEQMRLHITSMYFLYSKKKQL